MRSKPLLAMLGSATIVALVSAFAGLPMASAAQSTPAADCSANTTVTTAGGSVCGVTAKGVTSYLGVPFAAPPVGQLRFASPQPAASWSGVLKATQSGNTCPAPGGRNDPGMAGHEDCLNLNVQVPAGVKADAKLPVMVEIHGGGFLSTAFGSLPDGAHLVTSGPVVFVAINYRTGILGFLAGRSLGPNSGDWGLQDQQAALRWVQSNITRFGGDPQNVTIFGTSAGGASVCAQTMSPSAKGLFKRGISRSGFYNSGVGPNQVWEPADCKAQWPTLAQAEQAGAAFAVKVGCTDASQVAACLRKVPAETLVAKAGQVLTPSAGGTIAPTINGTTIPMSPAKAFATGRLNDVGIIIGVDRDEINGGVSAPPVVATTDAQYRQLVNDKYGSHAAKVMQLYPPERFPAPSAFLAYRTLVADADSVCPALVSGRNLARTIPTYVYEVDDASAPVSYLSATLPWGAYHGAGGATTSEGKDANQAALAVQVTNEWIGYARTGDPTAPGSPLWTRYTKAHPDVMSLVPGGDSALVPTATLARQHHCDFWDSLTPTPRD